MLPTVHIKIYLFVVSSLYWLEDSRFFANADTPATAACNQEILDRSIVTQCGASLCEPALDQTGGKNRPNEWPKTKDEVVHIVSSRAGPRMKVNTYTAIDSSDVYYEDTHVNTTIFVDTKLKYQRILGFGTTLTDASCTNIDDLPDELRTKIIGDYFSTEEGIGLNLIKVPIGATKYSYTHYSLHQPDSNQVELSAYDIDHRLPIIRDALKAAGRFRNRVKILASSATAPPELKSNNELTNGGSIKGDKFDAYAAYLVGYVAALKANNVNIWSLILSESPASVGRAKSETNETLDYNSMSMKPSEAIKLIKAINRVRGQQLAPGAESQFRMLLLGDSRAYIPVWSDAIFKSEEIAKSVAGVAHVCDQSKAATYDNLAYVTRRYPNKYLLATQGSINTPIKLGNWQYAENYASEIVKNLEFGSVGWIDFNMALNLEGGPFVNSKYKGEII